MRRPVTSTMPHFLKRLLLLSVESMSPALSVGNMFLFAFPHFWESKAKNSYF